MRRFVSFAVVVVALFAAGTTWAQAPIDKVLRGLGRGNRPRPPDAQSCLARRNAMSNDEKYVEQYRTDIAGIDAEMAQLRRRLEDLQSQRDSVQLRLVDEETRLRGMRDAYNADCRGMESCQTYESQAGLVDQQSDALDTELTELRNDVGQIHTTIDGLDRRIAPLQREYSEKVCNNLVPGGTEQAVIDRCMRIFTEWNRLQAEINRQSSRMPEVRSRHQQIYVQLQSLETRSTEYNQYLTRNCPASPAIRQMRDVTSRRQAAENLGRELDELSSQLARLKSTRITIAR
jgi:predicted  nucleic acid-binding Zn-ribbon protein